MLKQTSRGFTLIEMLVVMVIIGVVVALVALNPIGILVQRRVDFEASRLQVLLQQARDEAMIKNRVIGLKLEPRGYRWLYLKDDGSWSPIKEGVFRPRTLDDGVSVHLLHSRLGQKDNSDNDKDKTPDAGDPDFAQLGGDDQRKNPLEAENAPQIVVFDDLEISAFQLQVRASSGDYNNRYVVSDGIGPVKLENRQPDWN